MWYYTFIYRLITLMNDCITPFLCAITIKRAHKVSLGCLWHVKAVNVNKFITVRYTSRVEARAPHESLCAVAFSYGAQVPAARG